MRGTCSWSALLLQISETRTLYWLQSAQVSWLGLCGPETSPGSAGTSVLASIECHADDRQTLFHPFSLVGCQECCKLSFPALAGSSSDEYDDRTWKTLVGAVHDVAQAVQQKNRRYFAHSALLAVLSYLTAPCMAMLPQRNSHV